jgi:hypothetical protein
MTIAYSFETSTMTNVGGKKQKESKSIVDGDKGVTVYFLRKTDTEFKKVKAIEKEGKFNVMVKVGEGEEKVSEMDEKEFLKMAKADDDLEFAVSYMKKRIRGGARRMIKKVSKKASKKPVKKTTKKGGSKKGSKKVVRTRKASSRK